MTRAKMTLGLKVKVQAALRSAEQEAGAGYGMQYWVAVWGARIVHRGKTYRLERCFGEAHGNAYIDNCLECAPLWGIVVREVPR